MLKILGRANSIHVRKILWYCDEIDLEYERIDWGRGVRETATPEYLSLNPTAQIPTLIDTENDNYVLWESSAILRYLSDQHGPDTHDWYPTNPRRRGKVDQWLDWCSTDVAYHTKIVAQTKLRGVSAYPADVVAHSEAALRKQVDLFSDAIAKSDSGFIADDFISIADIACGLHANRWVGLLDELKANKPLQAYLDTLAERACFKRYGGPDNV